MPANSGIAFVLVPHLDPSHESLMVDLLSRQTRMPVTEAADGALLEANHVYIIPPSKYLAVAAGRLRLTPSPGRRGQTAIDFSLESLAADQGERAIGIILSGTGSHGSQGLRDVKHAGGMVMVQDPTSAEYDQMPRNAISTGLVDFVLRPEAMPPVLMRYVAHPYLSGDAAGGTDSSQAAEVTSILAFLQSRLKFDFRPYRRPMIVRRIHRRMSLAHIGTLADYLAHLRSDPAEGEALCKDLLIGVTSFFRGREAFQVLETRVIPELLASIGPDRAIRVWVPACGTGEEAYSIAMLFLERFSAAGRPANLQVFATDIDDESLEVARQGVYPDAIQGDVGKRRLERFFTRVDNTHYQVTKLLRETIVFAPQNLLTDAPFSRIDLISCRNMLIYLESEVQDKVIAVFHFALNEGGYLLLGPSESVGRSADLFTSLAKKERVYRRTGPTRRELVDIPIVGGTARRPPPPAAVQAPVARGFADLLSDVLAGTFAPASVLMNRRYEVLALQGPVDDYLTVAPGELTSDLLSMLRKGLRAPMRAACQRAMRLGETVRYPDARVLRHGGYARCVIAVRPLTEPRSAEGLLLVTLEEGAPDAKGAGKALPPQELEESVVVQHLESELRNTRDDLQSTIEEMESANEELKASNEEVMSMNEELQSANEELETSKEELQSLNEEITTVNNQLQDKVDQLDQANSDLLNLLANADVAMMFLSPDLRIMRFTPATGRLLNVIASDIGRPLQDFAPKFSDPDLAEDCRTVLRTLTPLEREVGGEGERRYLRRIRPYRTVDDRIDGVVVAFIDMTERLAKEHERERAEREAAESARLAAIVDNLPAGAVYVEADALRVNPAAERITGFTAGELRSRTDWFARLYGAQAAEARREYETLLGASGAPLQTTITGKDGRPRTLAIRARRFDHQEVWLVEDVTAVTNLQERQEEIERRLAAARQAERMSMARDLHDDLGGELAGLGLLAHDLREQLEAEDSPHAPGFGRLVERLRVMHERVRTMARGLQPVSADPDGLAVALQDLVRTQQTSSGVSCRLVSDALVPTEDLTVATHLFYIAQEAVTNAVRHAEPSEVIVELTTGGEELHLRVTDDGIGFDDERARRAGGLGLSTMRQRCREIGGAFSIDRRKGGGTVVACDLPRRLNLEG